MKLAQHQRAYTFFALLLILTIFTQLPAQDTYVCESRPACWEGFYLNGQLGMGVDREHSTFANANYFNTLGPVVLGSHFHHKAQGFVGGGALGFNCQFGRLVVGIEGGAISTNLNTSRASPFFPASDTFTSALQCIASGKGRIGYACDSLLIFASGGWAGGQHILKMKDPAGGVFSKSKTWARGWTVGGGFDCMFGGCYSLGLEYDYTQLRYRNKTLSCPNCGSGVGLGSPKVNNELYVQTLTIRFNYFFTL